MVRLHPGFHITLIINKKVYQANYSGRKTKTSLQKLSHAIHREFLSFKN